MTVYVIRDGKLVDKDTMSVPSASLTVIRDIEPYKPVAADIDGTIPVIHSRSRHREFLARNKYVEMGTEKIPPFQPKFDSVRPDVIRALHEVKNR